MIPYLQVNSDLDQYSCVANEEFDKLCFDFGVELDEDVRLSFIPYGPFVLRPFSRPLGK